MSTDHGDGREVLEIRIEAEGPQARVVPVGEIDIASAPELEAALREVTTDDGRRVVVDLLYVTFVDASGLRALAEAATDASERGLEFGVAHPRLDIWSLLVLTGLDEVVPLVEA